MDIVKQLVESRPDFFANRIADLDEAIRINDFIYMSIGLSNAYMVLAGKDRIIINTGMGFEALTHKKVFDAIRPGPTPFIILTQGHVDHVGGVSLFRESGTHTPTKVIAQSNLAACQRDDKRIKTVRESQAYIWFQSVFDKVAADRSTPRPAFVQDTPTADISFDDRYAFEHGGLQFEIYATPGGETIDSSVVWLPQHKILFCGNVFGPLFPHFPNFNTIRGDRYRQFEPYLDSLRRIRALDPELLITGHFEPIAGSALIRACLDRLEAAVDFVHTETLKGMNGGKDIWTLMREVQLPAELYVGQGYGKVSWGVRTVWETYMGWFKAQATSELYPTQPRELYGELVALAGVGPTVARGRKKLQANDPEAAQLLAEAALAHDGTSRDALQLSLDAHKALLARSGGTNFWETGWLKTHIGKLERTLAAAK